VPVHIDADYRRYVDGKPRYDRAIAFLAARSIELPAGTPEDAPVCTLCTPSPRTHELSEAWPMQQSSWHMDSRKRAPFHIRQRSEGKCSEEVSHMSDLL
jgi:hypothetical protein